MRKSHGQYCPWLFLIVSKLFCLRVAVTGGTLFLLFLYAKIGEPGQEPLMSISELVS